MNQIIPEIISILFYAALEKLSKFPLSLQMEVIRKDKQHYATLQLTNLPGTECPWSGHDWARERDEEQQVEAEV